VSAPVFALVVGVIYVAAGGLGFAGALPVTNLLSALYLAAGAWGCAAWAGATGAVRYARWIAVLFGALCVLNFVPGLRTLFTLAPYGGADFWLHAATALLAARFGFRSLARTVRRGERRHIHPDRRLALHPVALERRRGVADRRFGGALSNG
jgi:hypothetical protein